MRHLPFNSRKPHTPRLFMAHWPQTYGFDFCRGVWGQRRWAGCWLSTSGRMEERRSEQLEVHGGGRSRPEASLAAPFRFLPPPPAYSLLGTNVHGAAGEDSGPIPFPSA